MKRIKMFVLLIAIMLSAILCLDITSVGVAHALSLSTNNSYTNVLEDLQKDETFNVEDYPANDTDYSLDVIQVSESNLGELFIYAYQPSAKTMGIVASEIRFSTTIGDSFSPKDYTLTFLNSNGVFYKYKVDDFTIKSDAQRYYEIVQLARPWNENIDKGGELGNTIKTVPYEVGKLFTLTTINNEITYTCLDSETIEITQKHVGTIRYLDGTDLLWHTSYTESHYVAFSTDWDIDRLMEADVSWTQRSYTATGLTIMWEVLILPVNTSYGSTEYKEKTLSCEDPTIYTDQYGLFGRSYNWERIQSVDEFIEQEGEILNDDVKNKVEKMQWVLRFHETPFDHNIHAVDVQTGTKVDDVTILRLKLTELSITWVLLTINKAVVLFRIIVTIYKISSD